MIVDYDKNLVACHLCWHDKYNCFLYRKFPSVLCNQHHRLSKKDTAGVIDFYLPDEVIEERNIKLKQIHIPEFTINADNDPIKFFKYD